jgi:hypothetical protein
MKNKTLTISLVMLAIIASALIHVNFADAQPASGGMNPAYLETPVMTPAKQPSPMPVKPLVRPVTATTPTPMDVGPTAMTAPVTSPMAASPAMSATPAKADVKKKGMNSSQIVDLIFGILGGIASLVFTVLGGLGYMKWTAVVRKASVQKYVDLAFSAVEALVKKTDTEVDDKLVEFLKMVNALLVKHGEPELDDIETAAAKETAAKKALAEKLNGVPK